MVDLDTKILIYAMNQRRPAAASRLGAALAAGTDLAISAIARFELEFGIAKSQQGAGSATVPSELLASGISVVPFDAEDARHAGDIRADLERAGTPMGAYDLLIAAHARRHGAILVTANSGEFARVPGLVCEDWSG